MDAAATASTGQLAFVLITRIADAALAPRAVATSPVREAVLERGLLLAGPSSWRNRPGYRLFQGRRDAATTGYETKGDRIPPR